VTKLITRDEYDQLTFYKSMNDQLNRMSNRLFYYSKKILDTDENGDDWLTDYFDNDNLSVTELFEHLDIDIK
jgi:hypothetical protein